MRPSAGRVRVLFVVAAVCGLSGSALRVRAATIAISPSQDNTLYESATGTLSNGAGSHLFAGTAASGLVRRGLLAFNIAGNIPAGSTILSASLRMHMSRTIGSAEVVDLHRVSSAWGEGSSVAFGEEGGGAPPQPGDATWVHTFYDTADWASPGGDFDPAASGSTTVIGVAFYTWPTTAGLVADVQSWLDNPATNNGWLLHGDEEFTGTAKRFDSRQHPDPAMRPVLTINYQPIPEPATGAYLLTGFFILLRSSGNRGARDQSRVWHL